MKFKLRLKDFKNGQKGDCSNCVFAERLKDTPTGEKILLEQGDLKVRVAYVSDSNDYPFVKFVADRDRSYTLEPNDAVRETIQNFDSTFLSPEEQFRLVKDVVFEVVKVC